MPDTITAFVEARISEMVIMASARPPTWDDFEPDNAKEVYDEQWHTNMCGWRTGEGLLSECICDVPARVLAQCKAYRAIVELHETVSAAPGRRELTCAECGSVVHPCPTLRALASIWADHPDFNPDWAVQDA